MAIVLPRSQPVPTTSDDQSQAKTSFYRPELNSLRFFAFLLVFIDHSLVVIPGSEPYIYAGAYGVPVFFTLSAYLIVSLLVREQQATGTIRLGYFYVRRILRIWPLYFAALFAGFVMSRLHEGIWMPRRMLISYLLLAGNFYVARNGWADSPTSILWSLSIEEQFYLCIPLIAKFLGVRGLRIVCWFITFSAFPVLIRFGLLHIDQGDIIQVNLWVCFQFFGAGGLLALHPRVGIRGHRLALRLGTASLGLFCFLSAAGRFARLSASRHTCLSLCFMNVLVLAGAVLLFLAFLNYPAKRRSLVGTLGLVSYGLYVFHPWCLEFAAEFRDKWFPQSGGSNLLCDVAAFALTVLVALFSYKVLERPTLQWKQRFEIVRTLRA